MPDFITWILNFYIIDRLSLGLSVLTPTAFENRVKRQLIVNPIRAKHIIECIMQYNSKSNSITVTGRTFSSIKSELSSLGIHYITGKVHLRLFHHLYPENEIMRIALESLHMPDDEYGDNSS